MQDWKIQKTSRFCRRCGREFQGDETVYSAIHERAGDEFDRKDLCGECWPLESAEEGDDPPFSFWKTRMPTLKEAERISFDQVEQFFWKLIDRREGTGEESRLEYPLALLLLRKKLLRLRATVLRKEREILQFVDAAGAREVEITDPGLDAEGLARLEEEVRRLLFPERVAGDAGDSGVKT
jgi:hypothetical protein